MEPIAPIFIPAGDVVRIAYYQQMLFSYPLEIEGTVDVAGMLVQV